jgi:hypothetical protein
MKSLDKKNAKFHLKVPFKEHFIEIYQCILKANLVELDQRLQHHNLSNKKIPFN